MKNCGRHNVRKHREIKDSDTYIHLDILLKFGSLDKMRITSSDPKYYLGRLGKGLITSLVLNTNVVAKKIEKKRYSITNIIMRDISKIIQDFEKLPYKGSMRKSPKHEHTDICSYLARHIAKCMIRYDVFNSQVDPIRMEMIDTQQILILHVCDLDKRKSKLFLVDKNLLQVCSSNEGKP